MVFASMAVLSDKRFAARPVGAQSAIATVLALRIFSSELTRVVLPTPGPPVMTITLETNAARSAAFWLSASASFVFLLDPRDRLVDVDGGPGRLSDNQRLELRSDFALGSVKRSEEDASAAFERTAMSPFIREKKDFYAALFDGKGRLIVGSNLPIFGDAIGPILEHYPSPAQFD